MSERDVHPSTKNWRVWYERNKTGHNAERRQRYKNDAEYREAQQANARMQRRKQLSKLPKGRIRLKHKDGWVIAYRVSQVAALLEVPVGRFRVWEREGLIPPSIFNHPDRAYTEYQVVLLGEFVAHLNSDSSRKKKVFVKDWKKNIEYED